MTLTVINPATEEPIAELEQAGVNEADDAVARAKEAYLAWRAVSRPIGRARSGASRGRSKSSFVEGILERLRS